MKKGLVVMLLCTVILATTVSGCRAPDTKPLQEEGLLQNTTTDPVINEIPSVTEDGTEQMDTTAATETEPQATEPKEKPTEPAAEPTTGTNREDPNPVPTEPEPTESMASVTHPIDPEPTAPAYTEPEPAKTTPSVTEPPVTEPTVTEPATEPVEEIDLDALVQFGLNYAANTHGYRIYPGVRAGYYPAYTCAFHTMEQGQAAIRGCVDDTTRALLARPGNQIVTEIDGVICRARIDIVIQEQGDGIYLVNVYYG